MAVSWLHVCVYSISCDSHSCTQVDTECDFGYEFMVGGPNGSHCRPMTGFNLDTCPHVRCSNVS